jgi:RNA polymerase sigma-70 factor, ECF subfamily
MVVRLPSEDHDSLVFWQDVLQHKEQLHRYALGLTRNKFSAEDLLHDTLERVVQKRHQFTNGTSLVGWMTVIMRNRFLSQRRRHWREVITDPQIQNTIPDESVGRYIEEDEIEHDLEIVLHSMANLQDDMSAALILTHYADCSTKEVAKELGVALGTAKSRVHRAITDLTQQINSGTISVCDIEIWLTTKIINSHADGRTILAKACEKLLQSYISQKKRIGKTEDTPQQPLSGIEGLDFTISDIESLFEEY